MTSTDQALPTSETLRVPGRGGPCVGERISRSFTRYWFAYAMLLPVFLVMAVLVFYPLVKGIYLSFTDADQFNFGRRAIPSTYEWIGIDNYKTIVTSPELKSVAWFTVIWTFVHVFFHFTIGLGLVLALNRTLMFRGWYRMLLLIPWAVPSFISAFSG